MTSDPPPDVLDGELRADALDVLRDALQWRLTGRRWSVVEAAVGAVTASWRAGDVATLRAAVYELELAGPVRATAVGDTPVVDPPEPVREQINELIFELDGGEPQDR
jgi:hypothetical protein